MFLGTRLEGGLGNSPELDQSQVEALQDHLKVQKLHRQVREEADLDEGLFEEETVLDEDLFEEDSGVKERGSKGEIKPSEQVDGRVSSRC